MNPSVPWRDLLQLTWREKLWELTLSLPWLAGSLWCYAQGLWVWGALGSFYLFLTGFFAVWTVHHGCEPHDVLARTQRGRWINRLSYSMFFHVEHHLYPAVPTCHLWRLAERLDAAASGATLKQVVGPDLEAA